MMLILKFDLDNNADWKLLLFGNNIDYWFWKMNLWSSRESYVNNNRIEVINVKNDGVKIKIIENKGVPWTGKRKVDDWPWKIWFNFFMKSFGRIETFTIFCLKMYIFSSRLIILIIKIFKIFFLKIEFLVNFNKQFNLWINIFWNFEPKSLK